MNYTDLSTLVLIDSGIEDAQILIDGVIDRAEVIVLNSSHDSISQISQILAKLQSLESLHIVSHGQPGHLQLGTTALNSETLPVYADQIRQWKRAFAPDGNILLYGCQVAAQAIGKKFVQTLHELTQVGIAASATLTGCTAQGGDWNLDVQLGKVDAAFPFQPSVLSAYAHVLPTPNLLYGSNAIGDVLKIVNTSDGSFKDIATLKFKTFALARDAATGRIYYIQNIKKGAVAYYDPATKAEGVLPNTTGVDQVMFKLAQSVSGQLYSMDDKTSNLYVVDKDTGKASTLGLVTGLPIGGGDIAFDPTNANRLFVTVPNGGFVTVYTVDTDPNSANFLKATLVQSTTLSTTSMGALAFGADGSLYTVSNKELYRLDPAGVDLPKQIGTAAGNYSDFGSLPVVTPTADLQITVSDGLTNVTPNSSITYTVTVTNSSTTDLTNIAVSDLAPADVTGVTWTAAITGSGGFPTPADQTGSGNTIAAQVNLNAGDSVTYTIKGTVSSTATPGTTLTNSATVSADGINDPDLSNNSAKDTTTIVAGSSLTVTVKSLTTADRTPALTGTVSDPNAVVNVTINGQTYAATNNKDGTWTLLDDTIPPASALKDGTYDVIVTATDTSNNTATDTTTNELVVDGAPVVTVKPLTTADRTPALSGTVDDPNATVSVTVNGQTYAATNNKDGTWTLPDNTIPLASALKDGTYDVTATATDSTNHVGTDATTDELVVDAAPIVTVKSLITADRTPELTGTVDDPDAIVSVTVDGKTYGAANNKNGTWTLADNIITPDLAEDTYDVIVSAKNSTGNTGNDTTKNELVIDVAPTVTVNLLKTGDSTPQLTGTVDDPAAIVTVTVNGKAYTATNNKNGTWTLPDNTLPALADGTYSVLATAKDAADNTGTDSTSNELTIDSTLPQIIVKPIDTVTGEDGSTGMFQVVLNRQPSANVTLSFSSSDSTEGRLKQTQVIFTPTNWQTPQVITVTGVDDTALDGKIAYSIKTSVSSADSRYNGLAVAEVGMTNLDNEKPRPNQAPVTANASSSLTPGKTVQLSGLTATDADGTIASYRITSLPPIAQGKLYLGNPASGGKAIQMGQVLSLNQIKQVFFQSSGSFTGTSFSYAAKDNAGAVDATPATVRLHLPPSSTPPQAQDVSLVLKPGEASNISNLLASDADSTITSYTIATLPLSNQGILYLGNPAQGGTLIRVGQVIPANQIQQLFFQATDGFSGASFTYTATDITGTSDTTPATVVLSTDGSSPEDCGCSCDPGASLDGTPRRNNLQGTPNLDRINGRKGSDILHGLGCDDVIRGGSGRDRLFGDAGNDSLMGGVGRDRLRGGEGDDQLRGGRGRDRLMGGDGDDLLKGQGQRDRLRGGQGNDSLYGGLGYDTLRGGAGEDWLMGNRGRDRLKGGAGNDQLYGGLNRDRLNGGSGDDILRGGRGRDSLWGRQGNDILLGGRGRDSLWGYEGDDLLFGGLRRDRLSGGAGNDVLFGGRRADRLTGGAGRDQFVYKFRGDRGDHITDFQTIDVIDVSRLVNSSNVDSSQSWQELIDLKQVGSATVVQVDLNPQPHDRIKTFSITLENVNANQLGQQNFVLS